MRAVKITSSKSRVIREIIANNVIVANGFFGRLSGLILRKKLKDRQGLLIENCRSIHTIGMRYNIDTVFLNKNNEVIAVFQNVKPFRITPFIESASKVLELKSGTIKNTSLKVGDIIYFES